MLDKLRESTQALQGLTDAAPEEFFTDKRQQQRGVAEVAQPAARRKKSRFLRDDLSGSMRDEENDSHQVASRLANDILGIRNDSMGDYDKFRPEQSRAAAASASQPISRRYDFDADSCMLPKTSSSKFTDDDDTDALIQSLKQKTSRKHMSAILDEIESSEPAVKFEPIAKFKDTFRPSPSPEPAPSRYSVTLGRNKKLSSSSYSAADSYAAEGGTNTYGGRMGSQYYDARGADPRELSGPVGGGGAGHYGSLGRPQAKNYNQQYEQDAYGQPKSSFYNNSVDQPPLYGSAHQPTYGLQQQAAMYGQADPYGGQDMYNPGGYGQSAAYGPSSMQPRMAPGGLHYGTPAEQGYGQPTSGPYNPMGSAYGGLYGPPPGDGLDYGQQQPNSRQQRHQMRQQMYNMGGGWQ